uniref:Uncharacterized protein n=1 Tax=Knipowitschia caucasica TaxID=637954 RepID=A0AAV2KZH5_KNICA
MQRRRKRRRRRSDCAFSEEEAQTQQQSEENYSLHPQPQLRRDTGDHYDQPGLDLSSPKKNHVGISLRTPLFLLSLRTKTTEELFSVVLQSHSAPGERLKSLKSSNSGSNLMQSDRVSVCLGRHVQLQRLCVNEQHGCLVSGPGAPDHKTDVLLLLGAFGLGVEGGRLWPLFGCYGKGADRLRNVPVKRLNCQSCQRWQCKPTHIRRRPCGGSPQHRVKVKGKQGDGGRPSGRAGARRSQTSRQR